jgi:hypothetical protein
VLASLLALSSLVTGLVMVSLALGFVKELVTVIAKE